MANLTRVLHALYCEPWLITPEMHRQLCAIANDHALDLAHAAGGRLDQFKANQFFQNDAESQEEVDRQNIIDMVDGVGVISVNGVIGRKFSTLLNDSGVTSVDVFSAMVDEAAATDDVEAILVEMDTPGGTVAGTPEASRSMAEASRIKPVVVWASGLCCSAGYWISAPADAIFADESAEVGSIGVYLALLDRSEQFKRDGVAVELFKQGKFKAMGLPGTSLNDEQRELLQEGVDKVHAQFTSAVTGNRRVDSAAMEGQTFSGSDAVRVGLIDGIKSFQEALDHAKSIKRT